MLKKLGLSLLSSLFILISIPFSTTHAASFFYSDAVSLEETTTVAQSAIHRLQLPTTYSSDSTVVHSVYDLDDELVAYYFQFPTHYVLIAASKQYSPLLAAGEGEFLFRRVADGERRYYFGGINGYIADSGQHIKNIYTEQNQSSSLLAVPSNSVELELQPSPIARQAWDFYLSSSTANRSISTQAALTQSKLAVPLFYQRDSNVISSYQDSACGPTTMAAITEYWRVNRGFSKLKGVNVYGTKGDMINYFYRSRGGAFYGMTVSGVMAGLTGHSNTVYSASASTTTTYPGYRTEINNNRPVALKLDRRTVIFEPDRDYAYDYHWVVGKGYAYDNFDTMLIINNNESPSASGQEQYIDFYTNQPILSMVTFQLK